MKKRVWISKSLPCNLDSLVLLFENGSLTAKCTELLVIYSWDVRELKESERLYRKKRKSPYKDLLSENERACFEALLVDAPYPDYEAAHRRLLELKKEYSIS